MDQREVQGGDGEAERLSRALARQLDLQIDRLTKIKRSRVESLLRVKSGPAEVTGEVTVSEAS